MLIRSKIKREGGTHVTLDETAYHFKTDEPDAPHIANVTDKAHIARFLSITEGYQFHGTGDGDDSEKANGPIQSDVTVETADTLAIKAIQAVMADPLGVDDDTLSTAFQFLNGRKPNGKAKRLTIIDRIVTGAAEQGLIQPDEANEALMALAPAQEPVQEPVEGNDTGTTAAQDVLAAAKSNA